MYKNKKKINPMSIHLHFEIDAHKAFKSVFPSSTIKACRFHLGQSQYRKINSTSNIQMFYNNQSSNIAKWLTMFFGWSF